MAEYCTLDSGRVANNNGGCEYTAAKWPLGERNVPCDLNTRGIFFCFCAATIISGQLTDSTASCKPHAVP